MVLSRVFFIGIANVQVPIFEKIVPFNLNGPSTLVEKLFTIYVWFVSLYFVSFIPGFTPIPFYLDCCYKILLHLYICLFSALKILVCESLSTHLNLFLSMYSYRHHCKLEFSFPFFNIIVSFLFIYLNPS